MADRVISSALEKEPAAHKLSARARLESRVKGEMLRVEHSLDVVGRALEAVRIGAKHAPKAPLGDGPAALVQAALLVLTHGAALDAAIIDLERSAEELVAPIEET